MITWTRRFAGIFLLFVGYWVIHFACWVGGVRVARTHADILIRTARWLYMERRKERRRQAQAFNYMQVQAYNHDHRN